MKEINNKDTNILKRPVDEDHDGKPDVSVSQELSEDVNASMLPDED